MTQAPTLEQFATAHVYGAPPIAPAPDLASISTLAPADCTRLPDEWIEVDEVAVGDALVDKVIVGPNGVFAIHLDPDTRPVAVRPELGMFRAGARTGDPVKRALRNAQALRTLLAATDEELLPYPVLVTASHGEEHRLGRLMVVRPGRLAESLWRHPSRPLTRSARRRIVGRLRDL